MQYILALDQGTTSSRALIVNHQGEICGIAQKEFSQIFPKPGWVEHDPTEIWSSQSAVMHEVLARHHLSLQNISAIGITNQRETTIIWDKKTSLPIAHAIVWQDRRTAPLCQALKKKGYEKKFQEKTGLVLDPYFSGTKIKWLLDHVPNARKQAEKGLLAFGTIDSWLVWQLTQGRVHVTDATNASRTLLYNIHTKTWDEELLNILNIPPSMLPQVKGCSEIYGHYTVSPSSYLVPISGMVGDQQAALFGQSCFQQGKGKITFGTGCFILIHAGNQPPLPKNHLLTTIAYQIGNDICYAIEGSVFIGGAVIQWLRDQLQIIQTASESEELASQVKSSEGIVFIPAFTGLGAPYWNPHTRGAIMGITRGTHAGHITRAALEGIAFQVADVIDLMKQYITIDEMRVDGGAVLNHLLMQTQSDLLQLPLIQPQWQEITALGASFLAGLAVGYWKDLDEIQTLWKEKYRFTPTISNEIAQKQKIYWRRAVEAIQNWSINE